MHLARRRNTRRSRQAGMTLIELLIAMLVLAIGMAGILVMITTAIASNARNKGDSTATMVSQMVMERLASVSASTDTTVNITDCRPASQGGPQTLTLSTTPGDPLNGAGATLTNGLIDWTVTAVPANYGFVYYNCGTGQQAAPYEVRVNVMRAAAGYTKLITVSTRPVGGVRGPAQLFAPPVTLRTMSGR